MASGKKPLARRIADDWTLSGEIVQAIIFKMKSPFTNLGSNIAPDDDRNQAVDREREANETKFHPCIESCTFRNGKGGEREAAEFDAPTPETDHHFKFSTP